MTLANKVTQFTADADIAHSIIHGPSSGAGSTVAVDSGSVSTFAKLEADLAAGVSGSAAVATQKASDAATSASQAAASAAAASAVVTGVSVVRHSVRPSLLLTFGQDGDAFDPRITVARSTTRGRFNKRGLYETVAANKPGVDYDPASMKRLGWIIEEQRTNLLTYTRHFDNAAWGKSVCFVIPMAATAPDGSRTATKAVNNFGSAGYLDQIVSITSGAMYTLTVFAKAAERSTLTLLAYGAQFNSGGTNIGVDFNLSAGTSATAAGCVAPAVTPKITNYSNGWYRCEITLTATATTTGTAFQVRTATNGDGTSGLYLWGAQLEAGAFATSYIPATTTFTGRTSAGSYVGSNGLIQSASSGVARMQYNPLDLYAAPQLLLEAAGTNLILQSESLDNGVWSLSNATITANAATAPDGNATADKVAETATTAQHYAQTTIPTATASQAYTFSVFAKAAERSQVGVGFTGAGNADAIAVFDLSTGTVVGTVSGTLTGTSIQAFGNGWYRCSVTCVATSSVAIAGRVFPANSGAVSYAGTAGSGLYAWGAQLEAGSFASSYIATTTAQVTRAADTSTSAQTTRAQDVVTMPVLSSWYSPSEGTIFVIADKLGTADSTIWQLDGGSNFDRITQYTFGSTVRSRTSISGSQNDIDKTAVSVGTQFAAAYAYRNGDMATSLNGGTVGTLANGLPNSAMTTLRIGSAAGATVPLNGHIKRLAYYPRRLSSAELQGLTQ